MENYKEDNNSIETMDEESQSDRSHKRRLTGLKEEIIFYLLEDPKRDVKSFFKGDRASYASFIRRYSTKEIYEEVKKISEKKQQVKIKLIEEELEKQAKDEAFDISKLFTIATETLWTTINYIREQPSNYRFTSDAVKAQVEIMKFLLELKKCELVSESEEDDSHKLIVERVEELIEYNRRSRLGTSHPNGDFIQRVVDSEL